MGLTAFFTLLKLYLRLCCRGCCHLNQVCCREVAATGLPIIATAASLLGGTPFSAFSLFEAHQHEFSLSLQLILRDEWGGERRKLLLDRVRLPRGKHVGTMSTAIKTQYRRDRIQTAVEMDATAADRRKLAQGAKTLMLDDLVRHVQVAAHARVFVSVQQRFAKEYVACTIHRSHDVR